jgi:hypothetical protein
MTASKYMEQFSSACGSGMYAKAADVAKRYFIPLVIMSNDVNSPPEVDGELHHMSKWTVSNLEEKEFAPGWEGHADLSAIYAQARTKMAITEQHAEAYAIPDPRAEPPSWREKNPRRPRPVRDAEGWEEVWRRH